MRIGFLGLGTMGAPMARNLLRAGHALSVWNRTAARAEPLGADGAQVARSPREAAQDRELVLTMLADERALASVLEGEDGLLAGLAPGALVVEMSTVGRDAVLAAARAVEARGARFIDAPVSGSRGPAIAGRLLILAGGDAADVARATPALAPLGTVRHVGALGQGAAAKLCLNALGAQMLVGIGSALGLATRLGLSREVLLDVVQGGAFASPLYEAKRARLLGDRPEDDPDFTIALWEKDQRLVLEEAARVGLELPTVETVRAVLERAIAAGLGEADIAAVRKLFD